MSRPISRRLTAENLRDALLIGIIGPLAGAIAGTGLAWATSIIAGWIVP